MIIITHILIYLIKLTTIDCFTIDRDDIGVFWQITDIHYDANYSLMPDPEYLCKSYDGYRKPYDRSSHRFGDYNCDSPWNLVISAITAMREIEPDPDFILWTGDNTPHVDDSDISSPKVASLLKAVTDQLKVEFRFTTIIPSLGNHDAYPSNQLPIGEGGKHFYKSTLEDVGWQSFIPPTEQDKFLKGGYFGTTSFNGLRILSMNSNLWMIKNSLVNGTADPANQFAWLETELKAARTRKKKVIIAGHVPPGVWGRGVYLHHMQPKFNSKLLSLLQTYSTSIAALILAHEHTDSFRIAFNKNGLPAVPLFLAPAVTPWRSTVPSVSSNNPAIRLYIYNRNTGDIVDYIQYFTNLSSIPSHGMPEWEREYTASIAYQLPDISAQSLFTLAQQFISDKKNLFSKYFFFNSAGFTDESNCTSSFCRLQHVCSMLEIDYKRYNTCMRTGAQSSDKYALHQFSQYPKLQHHVPSGTPLLLFTLCLLVCAICAFIVEKPIKASRELTTQYHPLPT